MNAPKTTPYIHTHTFFLHGSEKRQPTFFFPASANLKSFWLLPREKKTRRHIFWTSSARANSCVKRTPAPRKTHPPGPPALEAEVQSHCPRYERPFVPEPAFQPGKTEEQIEQILQQRWGMHWNWS